MNRIIRSFTAFTAAALMFGVMFAPLATYASDVNSPLQVHAGIFNLVKDTITSAASAATKISSAVTAISSQALVTKAYVLDPAAWIVSQVALQGVIKSTVNWINSGFNGSPGFVTNLNQHMQTTGDTAALNFISQLSTNGAIKSPFQNQVAAGVQAQYLKSTGANGFFNANAFTLGQASKNPQAFINGDLVNNGGINAFLLAAQPQNNYLGAYTLALNAAQSAAQAAQQSEAQQLQWSSGVKSNKGNCTPPKGKNGSVSLTAKDPCQNATIIQPGAIIKDALSQSQVTAPFSKLISSNSLGQLVSSFLSSIITSSLKGGPGAVNSAGNNNATVTTNVNGTTVTTTPASPTAALSQSLSDQISALHVYQQDWRAIQQMATSAAACSSDPLIASTQTQASTALGQAASALSQLTNVQAEVDSIASLPAGAQADAMTKASNDFTALFQSNSWLATQAATDIKNAQAQLNLNDAGSIVSQLKAAASCAVVPALAQQVTAQSGTLPAQTPADAALISGGTPNSTPASSATNVSTQ